jgi:dipeptidyl aminopeptidase/acylaminoacyl peptidase
VARLPTPLAWALGHIEHNRLSVPGGNVSFLKNILVVSTIMATVATAPGYAQETDVVVRGTKRVKPADAPPPLELYAKPRHFQQIALSPDGSRIAFTTRVDGLNILVGYRFSDRQQAYHKLSGGDVSALSWTDDTHVLVSDSRGVTRGTCAGTPAQTPPQQLNGRDIAAAAGAEAGSDGGQAQTLLNLNQPPRCTYFGVRSENAITSVNMLTGTAVPIGAHIGDAPSQALGLPSRVLIDGQAQLVGPFMEMRAQSVGSQPAQRVFLWTVDPATGHGKLIDDGGGDIERETRYVDDWLYRSNGTIAARTLYDFLKGSYRIEMKIDGKWKPVLSREIIRAKDTFAPFLVGMAADGASVIILDSDTHGNDAKDAPRRFHYYALDAKGVLSGPLETSDAGVERPVFDPRSGRLAGFASQMETPAYDIREPRLRKVYEKALAASAGQSVEIVSVTDDAKKALIRVVGDEETGAYYLLDFSRGKSTSVGEDFPQIPTSWIARQDVFTYTTSDGTALKGVLTLPPKPAYKNLPLVVLPQESPRGQARIDFDWLSQALASRGYLVFQPNYRGATQWSARLQSDLSDGVDALVRQGLADSRRVCTVGTGLGGYAALKLAETGTIRCAVSINGISDVSRYIAWRKTFAPMPDGDAFTTLSPSPKWPRTFLENTMSVRNLERSIDAGTPPVAASAITAPVLIIHQDGRSLVPTAQSRSLREDLQAARKPVDYVELAHEDDAPDGETARLKILQAVTAFLAANNPAEN